MSSAYTVVWRECGAQKRSSNPRTSGLEGLSTSWLNTPESFFGSSCFWMP